jgi:hypothetical protein
MLAGKALDMYTATDKYMRLAGSKKKVGVNTQRDSSTQKMSAYNLKLRT